MQLVRQEVWLSRKHSWSQAPSKDFLISGLGQTVILLWPKYFRGVLHD